MANEQASLEYFRLGHTLKGQGRVPEAVRAFEQAVQLRPDFAEALCELGNGLHAQRRLDEALAVFRRVLALRPDWVGIHFNVGNVQRDRGDLVRAMEAYREAARLDPQNSAAWMNLGNACRLNHVLDEALTATRRAVELRPGDPGAHSNLGNALKDQGRLEEAIVSYQRALDLKPGDAMIHSNLLLAMYCRETSGNRLLEKSREWDARQTAGLPMENAHANVADPDRKLRIGYVSADFCQHSVAFFLLPLLEAHNPSNVEVTCYWNERCGDALTFRFQRAAARWRMIAGVGDAEVAAQIRLGQIDILVDLSGHTGGNRLLVFARKPAPIQASWLGFPGTTGLRGMDYRLSDALADPPGVADTCCTEKIVRLAKCAWCFAPLSGSPPVGALPALKNGFVTFGTFNNFAKASPQVLELWAQILARVPNSRLVLKNTAMASQQAKHELHRFFAERGITPERLTLVGRLENVNDHLCLYHGIDIALDTFPYHGTTTTCEALWMGVPVVTLAGENHCSRVGVSLLTNAGTDELQSLIASSPADYVEAAASLAGDIPKLAELREKLRPQMQRSPLMDARRFAGDMEAAYREVWKQWCAARRVAR